MYLCKKKNNQYVTNLYLFVFPQRESMMQNWKQNDTNFLHN